MVFCLRTMSTRSNDPTASVGARPTITPVPPLPSESKTWFAVTSEPNVSNAKSTPPLESSTTAAAALTLRALTVSVAPNRLANSSLWSCTSTAMILLALSIFAPWIAFSPTPPAPITATVMPARAVG